jgi:hypothetical protein
MRALLRKEWQEHGLFLALLYVLGGLMLAGLWIRARSGISPLGAWITLIQAFGTLAAVLVANRLVMREYGAGTQLFLEALPIGRGRVLVSKWLAGFAALMLFFAPAYVVVLLAARDRVFLFGPLGGLAGALAVRSIVYLLCVYAGAFAIALTLRFRFAVWGVLAFAAMVLGFQLQMAPGEWPPFMLVRDSAAVDAVLPSWRELGPSAGLALLFIGAALLLALGGRGALPVALARPMSARGRTAVALALAGLAGLSNVLERRTAPPAFRLQQVVSHPGPPAVHIGWLHDVGGVPPAVLAARIGADLADMQGWLGLGTPAQLAQVWLVPDAGHASDDFTLARGGPGNQIVRAALGAPDLDLRQLLAAVRAAELVDLSPVQAWREDRGWLLPGFAIWWGLLHDGGTDDGAGAARDARRALLQARAAAAVRLLQAHGLDVDTALRRADTAEELLGDCLHDAFSWRAVQTLHDELGNSRFRALMRTALSGGAVNGIAALALASPTAGLLDEAGVPENALAGAVERDLARELAGAPPPRPVLDVQPVPQGGGMVALRYRVTGPAPDAAAVPPGLSVYYKRLRPMEPKVGRMDAAWAGGAASGILPVTFPGGVRVLVMAEASDPRLACRYRLGSVRKALP